MARITYVLTIPYGRRLERCTRGITTARIVMELSSNRGGLEIEWFWAHWKKAEVTEVEVELSSNRERIYIDSPVNSRVNPRL